MSEPAVVIDFEQARARRVARAEAKRLTKREAAAYCRVGVRTIERWMAERGLPFHKPFENGIVWFWDREIDEWMEGNDG